MTPAQRFILQTGSTYIVAGLIGAHLQRVGESAEYIEIAQALVLSALVFRWCKNDARARNVSPEAALVAFMPFVGVPYYLFKTRPVSGALRSMGKILLVMIMFVVISGLSTIFGEKIT